MNKGVMEGLGRNLFTGKEWEMSSQAELKALCRLHRTTPAQLFNFRLASA